MFAHAPVRLETHCLYSELDRAIPALFELPGVPIADAQIHRATEQVKRLCRETPSPILHFKAEYSPAAGYLLIYQIVPDHPRPVAMWGMKGLPPRVETL